jgi:hypothetical protein
MAIIIMAKQNDLGNHWRFAKINGARGSRDSWHSRHFDMEEKFGDKSNLP